MKRFCLTLHLKNDAALISEYEAHHKKVWPEIVASIRDSGILNMQIYRYGTSMCMIMETEDDFSFEKKQQADINNDKVQQWEELMWKYQQPFAEAAAGEKWMLMTKIFDLEDF
jgi:L-rhamnose mutarotase